MKFINCIRDGRDIYCSARRLYPDTDSAVKNLSSAWVTSLENAETYKEIKPRNYFEIRYENLIKGNPSLIDEICRFAGIPEEGEKIIDTYINKQNIEFSSRPEGRWKKEMSDKELESFLANTEEYLVKYGYMQDQG